MDISLSLSGKKESVVAELRGVTPRDADGKSKSTPVSSASHGDQGPLQKALATYIDNNAVPDSDVTVTLTGGVTLTQVNHET